MIINAKHERELTMDETTLKEINLRLKQLVALKALDSIAEGNQFPLNVLTDYYEEDDERAMDLEREKTDEARERYQDEFLDATEALDKLEEERNDE